jgi:hypothetical protein
MLSNLCLAQGKILSKTDADNQFGKVLNSQTISPVRLKAFISNSGKTLLFGIVNGQLLIADNSRKLLTQTSQILPSSQPLHVFSITVLQELLNKGSSSSIIIEQRTNVLTITNGNYTLEFSGICPPNCP